MTKLKNITRISYKRDPEKGERGAIPRVSTWETGKTYYSGAVGETFVDFVFYDGLYYRCTTTHTSTSSATPYASINTLKDGKWDIESNFEMVATKVAFVGNGGEGWIIDNGEITHTSGLISLSKDGSIVTSNGRYTVDNTGKLICEEAEIKDSTLERVIISGSMRSPFVSYDGAWNWDEADTEADLHDNLLMPGGGSFTLAADFPWGAKNNGRIVTIVNYKYNGSETSGKLSISAPTNSGMYFFEDGLKKTELQLWRECVVLKGYGEGNTFYGWIVLQRLNIGTDKQYGRQLNVLAQGMVTGSNSGASISYKTCDGSTLSVSGSAGTYTITIPSSWGLSASDYIVMLTGYGYSADSSTAPIKATLVSRSATSFVVKTSDDSTLNAGSFMFQIINLNDWY